MSYYLRKLKEEDIKEVALIMKNIFLKETLAWVLEWKSMWEKNIYI